ncbi:MAG: hypothetical protein ACOXZ5_03510 [Syntrophomonadaceae bacterium]
MTKVRDFNHGHPFYKLLQEWQEELNLRAKLRNHPNSPEIQFATEKDIWLNFRSLFFTAHKPVFFQKLFDNLHLMPAINWLAGAPGEIIHDFLEFLPWYIAKNHPQPEKLLFLINIYHRDLYQYYWRIVNVLDLAGCQFLLPRTGNPELKKLLKTRLDQLIKAKRERYFGVFEGPFNKPYNNPTIYGDRLAKLAEAIESLSTHSHFNDDPYSAERFNRLLQSSDLIFECGMIEDCLAVLIDTYQNYEQKNRIARILDDQQVFKQFHKLLRKVIPFYGLIAEPARAYSLADKLFKTYFPRISPDPGSLLYLKLFEGIAAGFNANSKNIFFELLIIIAQISQYRPSEAPLLDDTVIAERLGSSFAADLIELGIERIPSMPHEGFIILELTRLLLFYNMAETGKAEASGLLEGYLKLFHWIPSRLFINHFMVKQLAPRVENPVRQEAERILKAIDYYRRPGQLERDLADRARLFTGEMGSFRKSIVIGKYLGVL